MAYTRREFAKLALTAAPALGLIDRPVWASALAQGRPNSLINGVQIGAITYSFRSMPDQSAEATLRYVVDSGVSAIELMGDPAEAFAGRPPAGRGGGRGGRGAQLTPEQQAEQRAAQQAAQAALRTWRTSVSMDKFKALRKMYNDAGVSIYAVKILSPNMSDEEYEYVFNVAEALGCTHTTLELPTDEAQLTRIGDFAVKRKIYAAYHTHLQGAMTAFDRAFALSPGNMANVDLGHYVAAGNIGGTPIEFLERHHARISSVHSPVQGQRRRQCGLGHRRYADRGHSSDDEEACVAVSGDGRDRICDPGRLERRPRDEEVRSVLRGGAQVGPV